MLGDRSNQVLVTTATLGTAEFVTDRRQQRLPAWAVHARGMRQRRPYECF